MRFNAFLKECQDKEVFKKLSIYAVFSWLAIQVISTLQQPMGLSPRVVTYALILLLIGFPVYIFYIWKFQIAPIHKKHMAETGSLPSKRGFFGSKTPFQRYYFLSIFIVSCLITLVLFFVVRNNFFKNQVPNEAGLAGPITLKNTDKIGVLKFENNTGKDTLDIVGKMAADWITHGITQKDIAQVVTPQVVEDYSNIIKSQLSGSKKNTVLQDYFKPAQIIIGNFFLNGNRLIFQSSITDGKLDKTLISLDPVECDSNNPLDCIEELKQRLLGFLITAEEKDSDFEETPPKYAAYETFLEAKNAAVYDDGTLELIEKAIEIDPKYFEPRLFQLTYYYDQLHYRKADSILKIITKNFSSNPRQQNIVQMYSSLLEGNNREVYRHLKREYDLAPFELNTNAAMLAVGLQYINRPEIIDTVFQEIDTKDSDAENCFYCSNRVYIKTYSDLALKRFDSVIKYAGALYRFNDQEYFLKPLAVAYMAKGKDPLELLTAPGLRLSGEQKSEFLLYTGIQSLINQGEDSASVYFKQLLKMPEGEAADFDIARAYYYSKAYGKALEQFEKLKEQDPEDLAVIGFLANIYALQDNPEAAKEELELLKSLRGEYQFGQIDYLLSRYYAVIGDKDQVFNYLKRAVAAGYLYTSSKYQYDPHFKPYLNTPEFKAIMTYWH
ncbi:tetratricopeptide repeat protein [Leeuwenhoekiella nanhaiensis]|uniref:Uncharacterized protein n=1 Tax=Leeuwenhoekiella nanhaiensis TaxID=1655491 RepID=A0A2G1VUH2_9FLAO|nr:hypothetical protein [Leeuwenhoekiella nanhaiensis]PHQ30250.1 hypothetical protein CJ305_04615 [Leeuwenhoekiella nanhaiensis]